MNRTIQINLPGKLNDELDLITAEEGLSKSELIKKALEDYLFIRKFRSTRKRMIPKAKSKGFNSDKDIFKVVS